MSPFGSEVFTIGHENVGVLTEVGEQVPGFAVGDRVVADPDPAGARHAAFPPVRPSAPKASIRAALTSLRGASLPA